MTMRIKKRREVVRTLLGTAALCGGCLAGAPAAFAVDCAKANLGVDYVICSDPRIAGRVENLDQIWSWLMDNLPETSANELLEDQQRWAGALHRECGLPERGPSAPPVIAQAQPCVTAHLIERQGFLGGVQFGVQAMKAPPSAAAQVPTPSSPSSAPAAATPNGAPAELMVPRALCGGFPMDGPRFLAQLIPGGTWERVDATTFVYAVNQRDPMTNRDSDIRLMFVRGNDSNACGDVAPCFALARVSANNRPMKPQQMMQVCIQFKSGIEHQRDAN